MSYYPPSASFAAPSGPTGPSPAIRRSVLVLYWLTAAASCAATVAIASRRSRLDEFRSTVMGDLESENKFVIVAVFVLTMLVVTSAIATAIWTLRLVSSAQARNVSGLSPGWAVGGWFVPVGLLFIGFRQIRRSVAGVGARTGRVLAWQIGFVGLAISLAGAQVTSTNLGTVGSFDSAYSDATLELVLSLTSSVLFLVTAALATWAITHADRAVEAVAPS